MEMEKQVKRKELLSFYKITDSP